VVATIRRAPPRHRVADVVRLHSEELLRTTTTTHEQRRALFDIERCRTAAMGAHRALYACGHEVTAYNSCRNRSCGRCLSGKSYEWVEQKEQDLLPVSYFHVVFTLPPALADVVPIARAAVYEALFRAASQTIARFGRERADGEMGVLAVLHTWGQALTHHPHLHCVVAGGAFNATTKTWTSTKRRFLFPVKAMSKVFRGKMLEELRRRGLPDHERADVERIIAAAAAVDWVVYAKPPFGGPQQVLRYLARYTHKIAISDHRIVDVDDKNVSFTWRDYRDSSTTKTMTLKARDFLQRFVQHVLPRGFTRLRSYGFLANTKKREKLAAIRAVLKAAAPPPSSPRVCRCPVCGDGALVERVLLAAFTLQPVRQDSS
jgi:hypothetical protein